MTTPTARFPALIYAVALLLLLGFTLFPVFSVMFTSVVADANGCSVNEGAPQPCMVMGSDWGELLYATGVMGWFMLVTLPLGGGALIVWLVMIIIHLAAWKRARRAHSQ